MRCENTTYLGTGAIATAELTTVANPFWAIEPGFKVNMTFVYLSRAVAWEALLPDEVRAHVVPAKQPTNPASTAKKGPFKNFPHYSDVGQLELSLAQANLLADLTGWTVLQNKEIFAELLRP
jgi:hypothetical protein